MAPTIKQKKPVRQKYPVNKIPKNRPWGSVKSNAEKAAYADWNGTVRERPTDGDGAKVKLPR